MELPAGIKMIIENDLQADEVKLMKYLKNSEDLSNEELQNKISEIYQRISSQEL